MDQSLLNPHTINTKLSALSIEGSGDAPPPVTELFYRQPGYSTNNLDLMGLLTKPFYLPNITIDSTFDHWTFLLTAFQPYLHQWVPKFIENFVSPLFNVRITFMVPGHQFAVLRLGLSYLPTLIDDNVIASYTAASTGIDISTTTVTGRYNQTRAANGIFFDTSPSSNTVSIQSNIPSNYPMNPMDIAELGNNPLFGGFRLLRITPVRFGMDLTSISIKPLINLVDVSLMPYR